MNMNIVYETTINHPSDRIVKISEAFGVGVDETHKQIIVEDLEVPEYDILYLTGMSGSGKTSLLNHFKLEHGFQDVKIEDIDSPIIDIIGTDVKDALYYLNIVGLGEAFIYVKPYNCLSDGQKYRFYLAKLLESGQKVICVDEFCSNLDRITAGIVSYNIQRVARKLNIKLIVATAHNDLQEYLQADYVFDFNMGNGLKVIQNENAIINPFLSKITIEKGTMDDYKQLGKYHYKNKNARFNKYIFKMTYNDEDIKDQIIGVAVFSCPSQQLVGRNIYFNKAYIDERGVPKLKDVNRDIVVGSRFIIHPMFRGASLGVELVKRTISMVDEPYAEVVSAMSEYNKFLDSAGLTHVCDNLTEEKKRKEKKIRDLFEEYGFKYEFIQSLEYCKKILKVIPDKELKNALYAVLRPNYFNNRARFKKYNIDFQTKKEFMDIELVPELLSIAKWTSTQYYIYENSK